MERILSRAGLGLIILLALAPVASMAGSWIREIEIKSEPEDQGQKTFMVRFTPSETAVYDEMVFECFYRQEMPWEDLRGRKYTKVIEPVTFKFRRGSLSFVNELDADVNFKVPVSYSRLAEKFGPTVFNKTYPISVNRILITAVVNGSEAWKAELAAAGKFDVRATTAIPEAPPPVPAGPPATSAPPAL